MIKEESKTQEILIMLITRTELAKRWHTTPRTIDRRRALGLLPWVDLARGIGKRPQIRFKVEDIETYERQARIDPERREAL
jgi:hypothetical protein